MRKGPRWMNPASVVRYKNSAASGSRSSGGVMNNMVFAIAMTAQIAQASLACRSESGLGAGCGVAGAVRLAADGLADAACATPWKCPNDSMNWIASAKSASLEPCLMFERNHFIPTSPATAGREAVRCYIITSRNSAGCQPRCDCLLLENVRLCNLRNVASSERRSAPLAQPGRGKRAEQQQQPGQPRE